MILYQSRYVHYTFDQFRQVTTQLKRRYQLLHAHICNVQAAESEQSNMIFLVLIDKLKNTGKCSKNSQNRTREITPAVFLMCRQRKYMILRTPVNSFHVFSSSKDVNHFPGIGSRGLLSEREM